MRENQKLRAEIERLNATLSRNNSITQQLNDRVSLAETLLKEEMEESLKGELIVYLRTQTHTSTHSCERCCPLYLC